MRSLVLMAAALVLSGSSATFAQTGSMRNAPAARTSSQAATSLSAVPGTIATVGAAPGIALGTIQSGVGTAATLAGSAIGTITACPTTGIATAPSAPFNATSADPITGALPPQPFPGATVPPAYSFGTSIMTGACNPTASATATIEALGASVFVTLPGVAAITGTTYSDAVIPSTATEAGGAGLSPLIDVPTPVSPFASRGLATTTTTIGSMYSGAMIPPPGTVIGGAGP